MLAGLWWGWLRVGLLGFGGGPSVIPLIKAEALSRGWATEEQFLDTLALGNTLPGPIAVKLAWALGQQAGGLVGAAVAVVALCLPGVALMTTLAALFGRFRDQPAVAGMMLHLQPRARLTASRGPLTQHGRTQRAWQCGAASLDLSLVARMLL